MIMKYRKTLIAILCIALVGLGTFIYQMQNNQPQPQVQQVSTDSNSINLDEVNGTLTINEAGNLYFNRYIG